MLLGAASLATVGFLLLRPGDAVDPETATVRTAAEGALTALYYSDFPPADYRGGPLASPAAAAIRERIVADIARYFSPALRGARRQHRLTAFNNLVACGRSGADTAQCVAGWERGAARFIPASHAEYVREAADDHVTTRLRSSEDEQQKYCKPLVA